VRIFLLLLLLVPATRVYIHVMWQVLYLLVLLSIVVCSTVGRVEGREVLAGERELSQRRRQ
jgi:hypothetical protein